MKNERRMKGYIKIYHVNTNLKKVGVIDIRQSRFQNKEY